MKIDFVAAYEGGYRNLSSRAKNYLKRQNEVSERTLLGNKECLRLAIKLGGWNGRKRMFVCLCLMPYLEQQSKDQEGRTSLGKALAQVGLNEKRVRKAHRSDGPHCFRFLRSAVKAAASRSRSGRLRVDWSLVGPQVYWWGKSSFTPGFVDSQTRLYEDYLRYKYERFDD